MEISINGQAIEIESEPLRIQGEYQGHWPDRVEVNDSELCESARRKTDTSLRNTVNEIKRELREEVGIDAIPDASPSEMRFIDAREVTRFDMGETVRIHWCWPLRRTAVTPDQNYCTECGDKLR